MTCRKLRDDLRVGNRSLGAAQVGTVSSITHRSHPLIVNDIIAYKEVFLAGYVKGFLLVGDETRPTLRFGWGAGFVHGCQTERSFDPEPLTSRMVSTKLPNSYDEA